MLLCCDRDQDSHHKAKLSGATSECRVLLSRQHSLFGYPADLTARFELDDELGKGGNAVVRRAHCKLTGKDYACKSIAKVGTACRRFISIVLFI